MTVSEQEPAVPRWYLACVSNSVPRTVTVPLFLALARPHLKSCAHFWASLCKEGIEGLDYTQRRAVELGKSLEHRSAEEWLGVRLSLAKRRLRVIFLLFTIT